jgi:type VI secretion system protein ImpA
MPSADTLDFDAILAAIPGDNEAGESVRYTGEYDAIQEARRAEDNLPMGDWQREVKASDWNAVTKLAGAALTDKTKDLQIAVWLLEGLVQRHGFAGLRDGVRVLRELQERFWQGLHPEIEDGDLEFRAGPLNWLNEKLPAMVRQVSITDVNPAYGWVQWDESRTVDNLGRQNPDAMIAAIAEGKISGEQFDKAVAALPRAYFEVLLEDASQCKDELTRLESVTDEKFARAAPSLIKVRNAIDDCLQLINTIVKSKRAQDPNYQATSPDELSSPFDPLKTNDSGSGGSVANWAGEPRSREEAFQRLVVLANYLKRVEPQHPVSYLLERAVRWTKMPLEQWLGEVIHNDEVLNHLRDTLGIMDHDKA